MIGAQHDFHDENFSKEWAARFTPTPERLALFDLILIELKSQLPSAGCVVELGIGPGYLADFLLGKLHKIQYFGLDFSKPMLDMAGGRLKRDKDRVSFIETDLVEDDWQERLPDRVDAVVSTWALHDLGGLVQTETVYEKCVQVLGRGGILLNGDFIKPKEAAFEYEPGRFETAKHLEILRNVGFQQAKCLALFEKEIESPNASQNYACFLGIV